MAAVVLGPQGQPETWRCRARHASVTTPGQTPCRVSPAHYHAHHPHHHHQYHPHPHALHHHHHTTACGGAAPPSRCCQPHRAVVRRVAGAARPGATRPRHRHRRHHRHHHHRRHRRHHRHAHHHHVHHHRWGCQPEVQRRTTRAPPTRRPHPRHMGRGGSPRAAVAAQRRPLRPRPAQPPPPNPARPPCAAWAAPALAWRGTGWVHAPAPARVVVADPPPVRVLQARKGAPARVHAWPAGGVWVVAAVVPRRRETGNRHAPGPLTYGAVHP